MCIYIFITGLKWLVTRIRLLFFWKILKRSLFKFASKNLGLGKKVHLCGDGIIFQRICNLYFQLLKNAYKNIKILKGYILRYLVTSPMVFFFFHHSSEPEGWKNKKKLNRKKKASNAGRGPVCVIRLEEFFK